MENVYAPTQTDLSQNSEFGDTYDPEFFALSGRIGRLRYLAYSMTSGLLAILAIMVIGGFAALISPGLASILIIALYIPLFAVSFIYAKRRLNDLDQSGWLGLLLLIPLVNFFFSLYLWFAAGTNGSNNYGPKPSKNTTLVIIGASLLPLFFIIGILAAIAIPQYQHYVERAKASEASKPQSPQ